MNQNEFHMRYGDGVNEVLIKISFARGEFSKAFLLKPL